MKTDRAELLEGIRKLGEIMNKEQR